MIRASVVFILNSYGQILVLKRTETDRWQPGKWGLPGGGLNRKETYEGAAIREIKEETGLNIFEPKVVYVLEEEEIHVKYFLARNFFGNVVIDWEHNDFKWILPKDLIQEECTPNLKSLALKYIV